MSWKSIVEDNGLAISEVSFKDLAGRIDAEYYDPIFIELSEELNELETEALSDVTEKIDVGFVGSMASEYTDEGIKLLQTRNIAEFVVNEDDCQYINSKFHEKLKKSQVQHKDILIARSGSFGNAAIYLEQATINSADIIIIKASGVSPFYLTAYLNSSFGRPQLMRFASGGVQGHINLTILEELKVVLPTDELEQQIEKLMMMAYSHHKKSIQIYKNAEDILLKDTGLDAYRTANESKSVRSLKDCLSVSRFDSEYWQPDYDKIIDIIKSYSGGVSVIGKEFENIKNNFKKETEENYRYIEIGGVSITRNEFSSNTLLGGDLPANAKIQLTGKTLLTSKVRPNRGASISIEESDGYIASGAFTVLKEENSLTTETLMVYLKCKPITELLLKYNTGTSYPTITDDDVLNLPLPLISNEIQHQISDLVKKSSEFRRKSNELFLEVKTVTDTYIKSTL